MAPVRHPGRQPPAAVARPYASHNPRPVEQGRGQGNAGGETATTRTA
jgi:hypothetical protein